MRFESPRFGPIEVDEDKLIRFGGGLPGLPDCTAFIVMEHDRETPLRWLQCVDQPAVAFLVVEPEQVLASYGVDVPPTALAELGWDEGSDEPSDVKLFLILNVTEEKLTANLRAPVVVNAKTRQALQLIVDDPALPLRHCLEPTDPPPAR